MYTSEALLDIHERGHCTLDKCMTHCRELSDEELNREFEGFGYPSVRLQIHHLIGAEQYWIGVLHGRIDVDENDADYPTVESLEKFRKLVYSKTQEYLRAASKDELNTARKMMTWGNREHVLIPAHVFTRTLVHVYQHLGQIQAICRLMEKPAAGLDYPIT